MFNKVKLHSVYVGFQHDHLCCISSFIHSFADILKMDAKPSDGHWKGALT